MGWGGGGLRGVVTWLIWATTLWSRSEAIWITLPGSGSKCVSEEIHANVVVLADYYLIPEDLNGHQLTLSVKVSSPYGNILHEKEKVRQGQFAFTAHESGNYLACFWVVQPTNYNGTAPQSSSTLVNLDWKTGIAANDWDSVAKKHKIQGVELELRKLQAAVEAIHENLIYLKNREVQMRAVSETTNTRVAFCSILSLLVCIAVSVVQILYLKRYFTNKKLI